jgi:hypothetical protein
MRSSLSYYYTLYTIAASFILFFFDRNDGITNPYPYVLYNAAVDGFEILISTDVPFQSFDFAIFDHVELGDICIYDSTACI